MNRRYAWDQRNSETSNQQRKFQGKVEFASQNSAENRSKKNRDCQLKDDHGESSHEADIIVVGGTQKSLQAVRCERDC